jgi:UDP-N-acetylmuramate dehydrogenase
MPADALTGAIELKTNEPLKPYTTFKIGGPASVFVEVCNEDELRQALNFRESKNFDLFVLGGGSNILVSDRGFEGLVVHTAFQGLRVEDENDREAVLRIGAGETWDHVVDFAVGHELWGLENLSHIPGQAGAALVQNIGAYGQQVSDVLRSATVMAVHTGEVKILSAAECQMGYRKSLFNSTHKNRFVILNSLLALRKQGRPSVDYPDVKAYFQNIGTTCPSLLQIREAIIRIRDSKFPFPKEEKGGNAGSFFKNLTLEESEYENLLRDLRREFGAEVADRLGQIRNRFPTAEQIKIPTAYLMEICGLKGLQSGGAKVNETQPLVLLNTGGATASDVLGLARQVRKTVFRRTGMKISLELELVGFNQAEKEQYLALA